MGTPQSTIKEQTVETLKAPPFKDDNEEIRYYRAEDFLCNLRFLCRMVNLKEISLLGLRSNIYYYREKEQVPYLDNVLNYWIAIYPYCPPSLTDDWRYLCSVGTFGRAFRQHLREVVERSWGLPWNRESIEDCLADPVIVRDLVTDTLTEVVLFSENLGNELGHLRQFQPETFFLDLLDSYDLVGDDSDGGVIIK